MRRYAYSLKGCPKTEWEPLADHLALVGELAARFAAPFGGEAAARAVSLLHDIGKRLAAYQRYVR